MPNSQDNSTSARARDEIDRPFLADDLSARASAKLGGGEYQLSWKAALPTESPMDFVLTAHDRVIVEGNRRGGRWLVYDARGHYIAQGDAAGSDILVDRKRGVFYSNDRLGGLAAMDLVSTKALWTYLVDDMLPQWRSYLARRGAHLVIVSQDQLLNHAAPTEGAKVEVHELAEHDQVEGRYLRSGTLRAHREYRSPQIAAALGPEHLVVAVRDRIEVLDFGLHVVHALDGKFLPHQLSIDGDGSAHVVVEVDGGRELWRVSKDARRSSQSRLPEGMLLAPPIIDDRHGAILVLEESLVAFDAAGQLAWKVAMPDMAGAILTGDGQVLIASGQQLVAYHGVGEPRVIAQLGERLVTPPALTADGRIYVASVQHLFALEVKP